MGFADACLYSSVEMRAGMRMLVGVCMCVCVCEILWAWVGLGLGV